MNSAKMCLLEFKSNRHCVTVEIVAFQQHRSSILLPRWDLTMDDIKRRYTKNTAAYKVEKYETLGKLSFNGYSVG